MEEIRWEEERVLESGLEESEGVEKLEESVAPAQVETPQPKKRKPNFRGPGKKRVVSIIGVQPKPKPELKQVIVRVPHELREKWKLACQRKGVSVQRQVVAAMSKWASWALKEDLTGWDEELVEKIVAESGSTLESYLESPAEWVQTVAGLDPAQVDKQNPKMVLLPVNPNDGRLWGKTRKKLMEKVQAGAKAKGKKPRVEIDGVEISRDPGQSAWKAKNLAKEQARLELMARASDWCWPCGEIREPTKAEREVGGLGSKVKWIDESGRFYDDELEQVQASGVSSPELQVGAGRLRWERTIWPGLMEGWRPGKGSRELVWSRVRYVLGMMERELGPGMPRELGREEGLLRALETGQGSKGVEE